VAVSGYLAVGMLLFENEGMFRALTVILTVELGALALGFGSPVSPGREAFQALRRRWFFFLSALTGAAVFALAWSIFGGLGGTALTQGLGLALLGGLPLYGAGLLFVALVRVSREARTDTGVAGAGALGACLGVLFTGTVGIARVGAPALLLFLLMILSATALAQGSVFPGTSEESESEEASESHERAESEEPSGAEAPVPAHESRRDP